MTSAKERAKSTVVAQRRDSAIRDLINAVPRETILERYGYKSSAALTVDVKRALEQARDSLALTVEEHRTLSLERLDAMYNAAWRVMCAFHVRVANGEVIKVTDTETGEVRVLEDTAPALNAIDRLLRIDESRRQLLGINAPTQVDVDTTMRVVVENVQLGELT